MPVNADEAIEMEALGMREVALGRIGIHEEGGAEMQSDERFPLRVGKAGEVAEPGAQVRVSAEKASVFVRESEVFIDEVAAGHGAGLRADEVDKHAAGRDETGELQGGLRLGLGKVGFVNDLAAASGKRLAQGQACVPEVRGGAREKNPAGIGRERGGLRSFRHGWIAHAGPMLSGKGGDGNAALNLPADMPEAIYRQRRATCGSRLRFVFSRGKN